LLEKGGKRRLSILNKDKQLLKVSGKPSKGMIHFFHSVFASNSSEEKAEEVATSKPSTLRNSMPNLPHIEV
jgi:hypothetical protein